MNQNKRADSKLSDITIHVRFKLFALWTALMFCFIYGDYFELYQPGKLQQMLAGRTAMGPATEGTLLAMSAMLALPGVMGFLSLTLPATMSRWLNVVFGVLYAVIMLLAIQDTWRFYIFFGAIEIALCALIVWYALRWPRQSATAS